MNTELVDRVHADAVPLASMLSTSVPDLAKVEDTKVRELKDQLADQELENRGLREVTLLL